jgi:hypothetical protein
MIPRLKVCGPNQTEINFGTFTLCYSYAEPVAMFGANACHQSTKYSRTTSKHMNQNGWNVGDAIPAEEFYGRVREALASLQAVNA